MQKNQHHHAKSRNPLRRESTTRQRKNMPKKHESSSSKNGTRLYLISSRVANSPVKALLDIRPQGTCPPLRNRPECNRLSHQLHSSIHSVPSSTHGLSVSGRTLALGQQVLQKSDTPKPMNTMAFWVSALQNRFVHPAAALSTAERRIRSRVRELR